MGADVQISKTNAYVFAGYASLLIALSFAHMVEWSWPHQIMPTTVGMGMWIFPLLIFSKIRNPLSKFLCLVWFIWFVVGSINIIASFLKYGDFYRIDVQESNFIYITYTMAYFLGLWVTESLGRRQSSRDKWREAFQATKLKLRTPANSVHFLFAATLIAFPFGLFLSIYLSVGFIPILLGRNIEAEMYSANYGYLYGFAAIQILSMLYVFDCYLGSTSTKTKTLCVIALLVFGFISVITGKRMFLMVFFAAMVCQIIKHYGYRLPGLRRTAGWMSLVLFTYIAGQLMRQGDEASVQSMAERLAIVGVEFRDFSYAVANFTEPMLSGYNWLGSTVSAALNSSILAVFGVDKKDLIGQSFGYIAKPLFMGGEFGVRTGLVSELYFAYGFIGVFVIFLFGALNGWLNKNVVSNSDRTRLIFLSAIYGLFALILTENSVDVAGTLTVFLYCWILHLTFVKLFPTGEQLRHSY